MEERIVVGKIVGVHGIKGELKVFPLTDDINRFYDLEYCIIKDKKYIVDSIRLHKNTVLMKLDGLDDRNEAEKIKNIFVEILREDSVPLNDGEYFIEDIKGLNVIDENGDDAGVINDVLSYGPVDIYEIKDGKKVILIPAVEENILEINIENSYMKVNLKNGVSQ